MTYSPFGTQPVPDPHVAQQVLQLEDQVRRLERKVRSLNRNLWALAIVVLVVPVVYNFLVLAGNA